MRSIFGKLLLAFAIVSLTGTAIFFGVARWNSSIEIRNFISDQDQAQIVERAASYYFEHGSWEGFGNNWAASRLDLPPGANKPGPFSPFTLIDINQQVVFGRGGHPEGFEQGDLISQKMLENALEITIEGQLVGWVLFTPIDWHEIAPDHAIFKSMDRLLVISGLGSAIVAVVLGILLSRTLSRPLQELSEAAKLAATGDLSQKVAINSKDEIGELALSFNHMMADLERLMTTRKQMTADIAHELRTPISIILGYAEGVHEGVMEPSQENFEIIRDEALRLERMVKDLKTLSQADVGELSLEYQETAVSSLLAEMERSFRTKLEQKSISLVTEAAPGLPNLMIDPERVLQAIRNILDNAVRHTPEGSQISIRISTGEDHFLRFSIQDSGPGIEPDELEKVFNRFYRTDSARTRDREGSGLGLAITRSVIEQHGGRIWAESPDGEGLIIIFELPV